MTFQQSPENIQNDPTKGVGLLSQLSSAFAQGLRKKRQKKTDGGQGGSQDLAQAAMNPTKPPGGMA